MAAQGQPRGASATLMPGTNSPGIRPISVAPLPHLWSSFTPHRERRTRNARIRRRVRRGRRGVTDARQGPTPPARRRRISRIAERKRRSPASSGGRPDRAGLRWYGGGGGESHGRRAAPEEDHNRSITITPRCGSSWRTDRGSGRGGIGSGSSSIGWGASEERRFSSRRLRVGWTCSRRASAKHVGSSRRSSGTMGARQCMACAREFHGDPSGNFAAGARRRTADLEARFRD